MNPLDLLIDVIPARYRRYVYALLALAALLYGLYEANGHDWRKTAAALVVSLISATAHANTPKKTGA